MTPLFPQLPHHLGGYTLTRLLASGEESELYEGTQARVNREVILRILRPGTPREYERAFLNRARQSAAADELPHVARVVESLRAEGYWFLAQERPSGYSLADLSALGHILTAPQACRIIETAAEVCKLCENENLPIGTLEPSDIYLNAHNQITLLSPVAKKEADAVTIRRALAACITPMRPVGVDGEQRILTLLQWLTVGYEDGTPIEWDTFRTTCTEIRRQIEKKGPPPPPPAPRLKEARNQRKKNRTKRTMLRSVGAGIAAVLLIGAMGSIGLLFPQAPPITLSVNHGGYLTCKRHGITQRISLQPVSVTEYEQFLLALAGMSDAQKAEINRGIPEDCLNHMPAEWEQLISTARQQEPAGQPCPMTCVNYWDALAYTRYIGNGATLPDAAQLQLVQANGGASGLLEWSASATGNNPLNLYAKDAPLLIHMTGNAPPIPAEQASERSPRIGFRIIIPAT